MRGPRPEMLRRRSCDRMCGIEPTPACSIARHEVRSTIVLANGAEHGLARPSRSTRASSRTGRTTVLGVVPSIKNALAAHRTFAGNRPLCLATKTVEDGHQDLKCPSGCIMGAMPGLRVWNPTIVRHAVPQTRRVSRGPRDRGAARAPDFPLDDRGGAAMSISCWLSRRRRGVGPPSVVARRAWRLYFLVVVVYLVDRKYRARWRPTVVHQHDVLPPSRRAQVSAGAKV